LVEGRGVGKCVGGVEDERGQESAEGATSETKNEEQRGGKEGGEEQRASSNPFGASSLRLTA